MIGEKDVYANAAQQPEIRSAGDTGASALYQAAARLADIRRGAPKFKTRDLVGLLLSHGARTWRNSLPAVDVRLRVVTPAGRPAVRMRVGGSV